MLPRKLFLVFTVSAVFYFVALTTDWLPFSAKDAFAAETLYIKLTNNTSSDFTTSSYSYSINTFPSKSVGPVTYVQYVPVGSSTLILSFNVICQLNTSATVTWRTTDGRSFSTTVPDTGDSTELPYQCDYYGYVSAGTGGPRPPPEKCGDGIDNDGDGSVDEECYPSTINPVFYTCNSNTTQEVIFSWTSPASSNRITVDGLIQTDTTARFYKKTMNAGDGVLHSWRVTALHSGGSADYDNGDAFRLPACVPLTPTFSFTYSACESGNRQVNAAIANLTAPTDANHPAPSFYEILRSDTSLGSYNSQGTTSGSTFTDNDPPAGDISTTGSDPPPNYFYKVKAKYNWRYLENGTLSHTNAGISVPTNAPGAGYDNTPACGANFGVSASPLPTPLNIATTGEKDITITLTGDPGSSNIQGIMRIYFDDIDGADAFSEFDGDETWCPTTFATPIGMPASIRIKCNTQTANPLGGSVTMTIQTTNVAEVNLGDHFFRILACDNAPYTAPGNNTHYRLKFNNPADAATITGISSPTAPAGPTAGGNCVYTGNYNIHVNSSPWIKISGGDVGAKVGPIDFAPAPSGKYNVVQNRYGKMALISGLGIYPSQMTSDPSDPFLWKLPSYAPPSFTRLQVGDSSANFYSALKGATIASKAPCDSCQNSNRLPAPGEDTVYQTNGFQLNTVSGAPSHKIVIFVNGSLTINTNIPSPSGNDNGVIFIVNGDVTINNDVTTLYAAIVADGKIDINGATATTQTLNFFGSLAGSDGVNFNRDLPSDQDATNPALNLVYDSRYVQNFQNLLGTTSATNWQEVAP